MENNNSSISSKIVLKTSDELWRKVRIYHVSNNKNDDKKINDSVVEIVERGIKGLVEDGKLVL